MTRDEAVAYARRLRQRQVAPVDIEIKLIEHGFSLSAANEIVEQLIRPAVSPFESMFAVRDMQMGLTALSLGAAMLPFFTYLDLYGIIMLVPYLIAIMILSGFAYLLRGLQRYTRAQIKRSRIIMLWVALLLVASLGQLGLIMFRRSGLLMYPALDSFLIAAAAWLAYGLWVLHPWARYGGLFGIPITTAAVIFLPLNLSVFHGVSALMSGVLWYWLLTNEELFKRRS